MPRRPDVSAKLEEEARILEFVAPRLSVTVPQWAVYNEQLIAYPRLPGKPGLTLDEERQPVWHFDPTSPEYAVSLGTLVAALHADFTYQYMMAGPSFELTVRAYVEAGGAAHPKLPERCAEATAEK